MWLFTKFGFFSAVQHRDNAQILIVRARAKRDLEALRKLLPYKPRIRATPLADYPYRVEINRQEFASLARRIVLEQLDYPNFKSEVGKHDPERARAYHDVWAALLNLEAPASARRAARTKYLT